MYKYIYIYLCKDIYIYMYDCEYIRIYYIELIIHLGNNLVSSFKHPRNEAHDSPRLPLIDFDAGNCFLFR